MSGFTHPTRPSDTLFETRTVILLSLCVLAGAYTGWMTRDWMPAGVTPVHIDVLVGTAVLS